jgi:uncharacterized membrane protein
VPLRRQGIRVIIPRMEEPRRNEPGPRRPSRARGALIAVLGAGAIVLAVLAGSAFLPRWWSHRIADQAQGNFTAGISLGLFYGFVFTLLPLLVLRFAFRRRRSFRTWGIWVIVALVLALPNLVTLGIVLGTGNAAHAGRRPPRGRGRPRARVPPRGPAAERSPARLPRGGARRRPAGRGAGARRTAFLSGSALVSVL